MQGTLNLYLDPFVYHYSEESCYLRTLASCIWFPKLHYFTFIQIKFHLPFLRPTFQLIPLYPLKPSSLINSSSIIQHLLTLRKSSSGCYLQYLLGLHILMYIERLHHRKVKLQLMVVLPRVRNCPRHQAVRCMLLNRNCSTAMKEIHIAMRFTLRRFTPQYFFLFSKLKILYTWKNRCGGGHFASCDAEKHSLNNQGKAEKKILRRIVKLWNIPFESFNHWIYSNRNYFFFKWFGNSRNIGFVQESDIEVKKWPWSYWKVCSH